MDLKGSHSGGMGDALEKQTFLEMEDTYEERWAHFEDVFGEFELGSKMGGVWAESEERQKKLAYLEKLLEGRVRPSLEERGLLEGIRQSLGFFSKNQLEELERIVEKMGEGLGELADQEKFEKGSKTGKIEKTDKEELMDAFDKLLEKFYEIVAHFASSNPDPERLRALINVAWTSIEACGAQLKASADAGQTLTKMQLIIFRFEQQLDALDPTHPFVPNKPAVDVERRDEDQAS